MFNVHDHIQIHTTINLCVVVFYPGGLWVFIYDIKMEKESTLPCKLTLLETHDSISYWQ